VIALLGLAGCWPDVRGPRYEPWDSAAEAQEPNVVHVPEGGGITRTTLDATDALSWVYLEADDDLAELDGPSPGWDLAFSRQRIMLDGGVSGDGGVELVPVPAARLEDVSAAPTAGWITDQADDDDENSEPEYAFDSWFDYNSSNHVLTPKDLVFVVRTSEGAPLAIEIVDYYDDAGSSGYFTLRWKWL
jgi:hypothetical protein